MKKVKSLPRCANGDRASQAKSQKEQVYECLKDWIIYTELKPGTPLNERELAERFGISRTPLREILQRLSYQRLIVIRPRKGIHVAPIDYLNIKAIFEVRAPIEGKAASLAARRAGTDDIESLQKIISLSWEAREIEDYKRLIRLDQIFHERLGDISKNPVLKKIIEDLHNVCLRFWYLSIESIHEDYQSVEDLDRIADAIRKRNHELAAQVL